METLYDTLKVNEDAPPEVIRAAYKALASKYHPDKNPGDSDAEAMMLKINRAYQILSDPDRRTQYDEAIKRSRGQGQAAATPAPSAPRSPPTPPDQAEQPEPEPSKFQKIWLPIILTVVAVRLVGALGAVTIAVIYYWLQPRKGAIVATVASIAGGLVVAIAAATLLATVTKPKQTISYEEATGQTQQSSPVVERDKFGGVRVDESATPQNLKPFNGKLDGSPTIEEAKSWTQESTGSTDAGPWLDYEPSGTRFCRLHDRTIVKVYPPGVKPGAEPANPFCADMSVSTRSAL